MEFLLEAFKHVIELYKYRFTLTKNANGTYTLNFFDLPSELDFAMIQLKYYDNMQPVVKLQRTNKFGRLIRTPHTNEVCVPRRVDKTNIITTTLSEDDYAVKINMIESCLRQYNNKKNTSYL